MHVKCWVSVSIGLIRNGHIKAVGGFKMLRTPAHIFPFLGYKVLQVFGAITLHPGKRGSLEPELLGFFGKHPTELGEDFPL